MVFLLQNACPWVSPTANDIVPLRGTILNLDFEADAARLESNPGGGLSKSLGEWNHECARKS
jgi:hypothetical protein